jgi:PDZ domain-containing protein
MGMFPSVEVLTHVSNGESFQAFPPPPGVPARRPRGRPSAWLVMVPLALLAFIAYFVRLPYFVLGPGPARDVEPLIHVSGPADPPAEGHFLLTSITVNRANAFGLLNAWLDPAESVVPERDILAPGETEDQEIQMARSQMDTSKIDAAVVALSRFAGFPDHSRPGALVERVDDGLPASGNLFAGDLIAAVDGRPVHGPGDLGRTIQRAGAGTPLHLTVQGRPGGEVHVTVVPVTRTFRGVKRDVIGVLLVQNFPFPLTIESGEIGGPSAGLMWSLGLTDLLSQGDLTGGRTIAGTGEIFLDGRVYPIDGIEEKVVAAERAGAEIFLAPRANAAAARGVAGSIKIVVVDTYQDALSYLQATGGLAAPAPPRAERP